MRWPWTRRQLSALEIETMPPYTVRVVGVDRREVDRVVNRVMDAADSAGAQNTVTKDTLTRIRPSEAKKLGFPSEFFGKMTFTREITVSGDEGSAIAAIGRIVPGSLVRIAIE